MASLYPRTAQTHGAVVKTKGVTVRQGLRIEAGNWSMLYIGGLFASPWTAAEFFRQEYWSGLPRPSPGDLHNPGIKPRSPALHADSLPSEPPGKPKNTGVGSLSPSPGDLPNPGIEPGSPALQATFIIPSLSTSGMEGLGDS